MKLICNFGSTRTLSNKRLDIDQLTFIPCLKPGRIMKDELRVAGEAKRATDIMDPTLIGSSVKAVTSTGESRLNTSEVGSSCFFIVQGTSVRAVSFVSMECAPSYCFLHHRCTALPPCCKLASKALSCQHWPGQSREYGNVDISREVGERRSKRCQSCRYLM